MEEFSGWGHSAEEDGAVGEALRRALRAHEALRAAVARVESPLALWESPLDVTQAQGELREALGRLGAATLEATLRHARLAPPTSPAEVAPVEAPAEDSAPTPEGDAPAEALVEVEPVAVEVVVLSPPEEDAAEEVEEAPSRAEVAHHDGLRWAGEPKQRMSFEATWLLLREALSEDANARARAAKALGAVRPADSIPGVAWSRERRARWLVLLGLVCRALHEAKCTREIKGFQKALAKLATHHKVRLPGVKADQAPRHGSWRADARAQALRLFGDLRREREGVATPEEALALLDQWSEASGPLWKGLLPLLERGLEADAALLEALQPWVDELEEMGVEELRVKVLRAEQARSAPATLPALATLPAPATQPAPVTLPPIDINGLASAVPLELVWRARLELVLRSCELPELAGAVAALESETNMGALLDVPLELRGAWGRALAALVRHMEEKNVKKPTAAARTQMMKWISKVGLKGQVRALYHEHSPQRGSWLEDVREHGWEAVRCASVISETSLGAEEALEALRALVCKGGLTSSQFQSELLGLMGRGLVPGEEALRLLCGRCEELESPLLAGVKAAAREVCERAAAEDEHRSTPGPEWEFWPLVEGRRAVMVGSAGKSHQVEMIKRAFRFSELEHMEAGDQLRRLQSLAGSIKEGDDRIFLLMHRYISHSGSDPIWERRQDAVVIGVDRGFAVAAVRAGIERDGRPWLEKLKVR